VALEVTAKTPDGQEVYSTERHYHPQATTCRDNKMIYGAQWKTQYIRNTSLQPYEETAETFEIQLPKGVRTVDVTVILRYEISKPDYKIDIHKLTRRVSVDRP
jgi:hypothetical protein